jgi:hypothetical protein
LRSRVEVVLAAGMLVETLFLFFTWWCYGLFSPIFDSPAVLVSVTILFLGTCLTGVVVGFLLYDKRHAAAYGFISAFIPSLFFFSLFVTPLFVVGPPLLWLSLLPFLVLFDAVAAAVGRWGSSIKARTFFVAAVVILLLTSLVFSGGLFALPAKQSGNLIVGADETYNISGGNYVQEGNITVRDNATLLIQNCVFTANQQDRICVIEVEDQGRLIIESSEFYVLTRMYGGDRFSTIYVRDNASAIVNNSEIVSHWLFSSQYSHVENLNSTWDYGSVTALDSSEIRMVDSSVESGTVSLGQNSSVYFSNSVAPYLNCGGTATLAMDNSNRESSVIVTHGYMHCSGNCSIRLTNSTVDGVSAENFQGVIVSNDSLIAEQVRVQARSDFYLAGDLTITGNVSEFNGDVTRRYTVSTAPSLQLNVTRQDTNELIWKGHSDQNGLAAFDITFTPDNYTQQLSLNGQVLFNFTSTTPLILPSLKLLPARAILLNNTSLNVLYRRF